MKYILVLVATIFLSSFKVHKMAPRQLKDISVYYIDSITNPKSVKYRKFEGVGDNVYWSKPTVIDIELTLYPKVYDQTDYFEILIEELIVPTKDSITGRKSLKQETWVPIKTVYASTGRSVVDNKITVKGIDYETAYFLSSIAYEKKGFRVVGVYKKDKSQLEIVKREFFYSM